ncbi:MAG: hypothetical protein A3I88_03870 [Candidatus Portnoybacteria bacterium RIFCSPLOWO2_12_FULL_39_9]|uniref:NGG1p interacting factor NIF3 n=1 Tax=Candidatus Portnoybacteria bacterium RIFCSPHIGHO2_12_FULL_38_9 TaxID=1801997 RepID=A0A1G2FFQ7_9BACT|nr:MAG: hypothetical protein A3H00_02910 [Candidatus Portnoybacteria bacterium RBG_13_40_8]OGZ35916.1 MAG: hypothetical protein A2646_01890 [Candidatus Portnoybacteria bacterium RIFCSPHIGHO2_02_FULL_39_12]OGZ36438.1 MAG: hypothetical protein A3J64_02280 [Candidatus Portnoybacteria bacterium RIFCSPHIGHO2_12_FULL_38_9]OGZ39254.1 MAG: hypothetical protein A3F21_01600 [Candidatus Portnoybacteria bacterium RIFCSPLOWO2_01_FULL_38_39]OGZ40251.1 MAG: hypothetical protein A3I88_03870 [Candidatus Portnoy
MSLQNVKFVVFVPIPHADAVRQALGEAGAGKIGNYDFCSFSSHGTGRFRGNEKANPTIGKAGKYEVIEEERIEAIVPREILNEVIKKVKAVHPYEEVAFDIYPLENL